MYRILCGIEIFLMTLYGTDICGKDEKNLTVSCLTIFIHHLTSLKYKDLYINKYVQFHRVYIF